MRRCWLQVQTDVSVSGRVCMGPFGAKMWWIPALKAWITLLSLGEFQPGRTGRLSAVCWNVAECLTCQNINRCNGR